MEAFEQFVALFLEQKNLVVSSAVKFRVTRQTRRADRVEMQTHGYEVDLIGARADKLVLGSVKSFLGSSGVAADHVMGISPSAAINKRYALLNDPDLRRNVVGQAARRYGYLARQVEVALFVGRFAGRKSGQHERKIREWAKTQRCGAGQLRIYSLKDMVESVVDGAVAGRQYQDNAVLVTMRVLQEAGLLSDRVPSIGPPRRET